MMKKWKKRVSLMLAVTLLLTNASMTAFANEKDGEITNQTTNDVQGQENVQEETVSTTENTTEEVVKVPQKDFDYEVTYEPMSSWENNVIGQITLTNTGRKPLTDWKLHFSYNAVIDNIWNATLGEQGNGECTILPSGMTFNLQPGSTICFGYHACYQSTLQAPPCNFTVESANMAKTVQNVTPSVATVTIATGSSVVASGQAVIPNKWYGLNYALFTSTDEDNSFGTCRTEVNGDVRTNGGFCFQGTVLKVTGTVTSASGCAIDTCSTYSSCRVGDIEEYSSKLDMPDLRTELRDRILCDANVMEGDVTYKADYMPLEKPIYTNGNLFLKGTTFRGSGIVGAKGNVEYDACYLGTPQNSKLFLYSETGDITINGSDVNMNAFIYAPEGCVYINANQFYLNGRIIAKKICVEGSFIEINATPSDFDLIKVVLIPTVELNINGYLKELRKVNCDITYDVDEAMFKSIDWTFDHKVIDDTTTKTTRIDTTVSTPIHKEMLFANAGTYTVTAVLDYYGNIITTTKEIEIAPDLKPIASASFDTILKRNGDGTADVLITDTSSSIDGEVMEERDYTIYFDKNNDGVFDAEEIFGEKKGNDGSYSFKVQHVGTYLVELSVKEKLDQTIPSLITDADYRWSDISGKKAEEKIFEVINLAPTASTRMERQRAVDIVFTLGSAKNDKIKLYEKKSNELKTILEEAGIDARISTISTSTLTAQDTFAWKEYDHYNYNDSYLPTIPKHIIYSNMDIKMLGYSRDALKDFLYVADDDPGTKIFEFDLQRDGTDWHSMEGGGFLFNTTVSDENNSISGFCILITQSGLKLIQISNANLNDFRNTRNKRVENFGRLLTTVSIGNVYANHHLKIETNGKSISVWDGDNLIIDAYTLPANNSGYGYGPIISHGSHACSQQSYFTFKNITMQTIKGERLSDVIGKYEWREEASHYVVNLSEQKVPELSENVSTATLAAALMKENATFIGIGNQKNQSEFDHLLKIMDGNGKTLAADTLDESLQQLNDGILNDMLKQSTEIGAYINVKDHITTTMEYKDIENDPMYKVNWEYTYEPAYFNHDTTEVNVTETVEEPIKQMLKAGRYLISIHVCDNPVGDEEAFASYRLWCEEKAPDQTIVVQTKPVATITANVTNISGTVANATVTYTSSDADHPDDVTKGITKEEFYYKNIEDENWTSGRLPNQIAVGETYLVKYVVTDVEGCTSYPAVIAVTTVE